MTLSMHYTSVAALAAAFGFAAASPVHAQDQMREIKSLEEMLAVVRGSMPDILKGDNKALVDLLMKVPLGSPLSKTFDPGTAIQAVFGEGSYFMSQECRRKGTAAGEPDLGDCLVSSGQEGGRGTYIRLSFSKNMGNGNIKFLKRAPVDDNMTAEKLPTAKLSDEQAQKMALDFLAGSFGLSVEEIPAPPDGRMLSVRSLALGGAENDGRTKLGPIVVQKIVTFQRGLPLGAVFPGPEGRNLTHVPLPGRAMVAVDDSGVAGAMVSNWQELRLDPTMTFNDAKPGDTLIKEIAEDLFNEGVLQISSMHFNVIVSSDWRGSFGFLLPAVRVGVAPVPKDLSEEGQNALEGKATAGIVKEYSLVERASPESRQ